MTHNQAIEAAARAIASSWFGNGVDEYAVAEVRPDAEAALRAAAPILMEQGARLALDAAAKALIGYIHPDPDSVPGRLFASAQVRDLDPAEIVKGSGNE